MVFTLSISQLIRDCGCDDDENDHSYDRDRDDVVPVHHDDDLVHLLLFYLILI